MVEFWRWELIVRGVIFRFLCGVVADVSIAREQSTGEGEIYLRAITTSTPNCHESPMYGT